MSEVVGVVLSIGITLVAGTAAWSFARNQAGSSEGAIQNSVLVADNYLTEHFNVVDMYFGSSTTATFWVYNTGAVTYQTFSVRLYGSAGLINVLYNYTKSGTVKTDQIYDLRSNLATKCKTAASSYETPTVTGTTVKTTNAQLFTLTLPGAASGCPSFGQTFTSGTTYTVVVTGLYGNVATFSQTM